MIDLLKVASWPLGFVMLAVGKAKLYLFCQLIAAVVFSLASWVLLDWIGLRGTGIAFLLLYCVYTPLVFVVAKRLLGFQWSSEAVRSMTLVTAALVLTSVAASYSEVFAAATGTLLSLSLAVLAYRRLRAAFTASDSVVKGV